MYVYDIRTKTWSPVTYKSNVPHPRSGCKGVVYSNDIYYFGGYTYRKGEYFSDLYRFNTKTMQWTLLYGGKEIAPRVDHSLVIHNKMLYIFGGSDGKNKFDDFYRYDIQLNKISRIVGDGDLPTARFGHTAEVYRS
jgi:N-acetylneuraminic acid mutarotase